MLIVPQTAPPPPVYLHVPPGHAKNWRKHCREYNACNRPYTSFARRNTNPPYQRRDERRDFEHERERDHEHGDRERWHERDDHEHAHEHEHDRHDEH